MLAQSFDAVRPAALQHDQDMQRRRAQIGKRVKALRLHIDSCPQDQDELQAELERILEEREAELRKMGG